MEKKTESIEMVIDSSIFVDHLRDYASAIEFFKSLSVEKREKTLFSAITEAELISGKSCNDVQVKNRVLQMLNSFRKIEVTNRIAVMAGDICRKYSANLPDGIIAATTITNNAQLLTKNIKDFEKIDGLNIKSPY